MADSILDKVLSVKHAEEAAQFVPHEILQGLIASLPSRERDVLVRRFGLQGKPEETLESIGFSFEVTRERIRQIERTGIQKIRQSKDSLHAMAVVEHVIAQQLEDAGGVLPAGEIMDYVMRGRDRREEGRAILSFFLHELLADRFQHITEDAHMLDAWAVRTFDLTRARAMIERVQAFLQERGEPMSLAVLLQGFRARAGADAPDETYAKVLLHIAKHVRPNPFGLYGLTSWVTITPRRMTDKIYLVMKKHAKPMHFHDITKAINDAGFDQKIAHAPTVHNELIMDERYVLVGRGMYGLQEAGFKPGVVADVIADILREAKTPLRRSDIVEAVLKQRIVGKATVHLALMQKDRFVKASDGRYTVREATVPILEQTQNV